MSSKDYQGPLVFGKFKRTAGEEVPYPFIAKGVINLKNVEVSSGKPLGVGFEPEMFRDYYFNSVLQSHITAICP